MPVTDRPFEEPSPRRADASELRIASVIARNEYLERAAFIAGFLQKFRELAVRLRMEPRWLPRKPSQSHRRIGNRPDRLIGEVVEN
jgi:hypothetical protein